MIKNLFFPIFAQAALTFFLLLRMAYFRFSALRSRQVKIKDIALGQNAWPSSLAQPTNSFHNQLEMPILFYAVTLSALFLQITSPFLLTLAWLYPLARLVHAYIHNTSNNVRIRFLFFLSSNIILILMWVCTLLWALKEA